MVRIVGGAASGRRLAVPDRGTRPTSERVREALFSALGSALGSWDGVRVLDLYSGSGALGLEALSRGAESVTLVERDRGVVRLLRDNVVIHEGTLKSLRRFKDEVKEVQHGFECGMAFENYEDIREGDLIECFEVEEVARTI